VASGIGAGRTTDTALDLRQACQCRNAIRPVRCSGGVHSNQFWQERRGSIRRVARQFLTKPCDALEIGTWMEKGSTQVWLQTLPVGSSLMLIDAWRPYIAEGETTTATVGWTAFTMLRSTRH
jgi:hypothetical protein